MTVYFPRSFQLLDCFYWMWKRGYTVRACDFFKMSELYCPYWVWIAPIPRPQLLDSLVDENAKKATLAC